MSDDERPKRPKRPKNSTAATAQLTEEDIAALYAAKQQEASLPFQGEPPPSKRTPESSADGALPFGQRRDPLAATWGSTPPPIPARNQERTGAMPAIREPLSQPGDAHALPPPPPPPPPPHPSGASPRSAPRAAVPAPSSMPGSARHFDPNASGPPPSVQPSSAAPSAAPSSAAPSSAAPSAAAPSASGASPWVGTAAQVRPRAPDVRPPNPMVAPSPAPAAAPADVTSAPTPEAMAPPIELLWMLPGLALRLRRSPVWRPTIDRLEDRPVDHELDDFGLTDPADLDDRREVFEVLARGKASDPGALRKALRDAVRSDGRFQAPLVVVDTHLVTPFDDRARLEATLTTVAPFVPEPSPAESGDGEPHPLEKAVREARTFLERADALCPASILAGYTDRIRVAFGEEDRELRPNYLAEEVELALLQHRKYQERIVFGEAHLRTLALAPGEDPIVAYLPVDLGAQLPMYPRFPMRMIAELHHRTDHIESSKLALVVRALGRVHEPGD